mmetsp:Transcript_12352/g.28986  ORF Transcript_12352/g.28986 Transcript_12352/m.28986 type:complete len:468 (+) Transcript_12352:393-1796(+)
MINLFARRHPIDEKNDSRESSRWALDKIQTSFILKEIIGEGCFGTVRRVRSRGKKTNGVKKLLKRPYTYACKTIPRSKVDDVNLLKEECSNLESVRGHPHLLEFEKAYEDNDEVHIITELLEGGDLYDAVIEMTKLKSFFRDEDAAWMVRNILDGLSYCHDVTGIVHRDLKASNFMFKHKTDISSSNKQGISENLRGIKIIDYGLSTKIDPETGQVEGCLGTPYYVAPEVLTEEPYDSKCDVWSAGVIAYLILSKTLPFQGKDENETVRILMDVDNHQPTYDSYRWLTVEPEAVAFCKFLLKTNPTERPTAREAMSHPWIVKHCGSPPAQRSLINPVHSIGVLSKPDQSQEEHIEDSRPPAIVFARSSDSFDSTARTSSSYSHDNEPQSPISPPSAIDTARGFMESIPELSSSIKQWHSRQRKKGILQRLRFSTRQQDSFSPLNTATTTGRKHRVRQETDKTLVMND